LKAWFALPGTPSLIAKPEAVTAATQCFDRLQCAARIQLLAQACYQNFNYVAVAFFVVWIKVRSELVLRQYAMPLSYEVFK
jgi:hypothetical protein